MIPRPLTSDSPLSLILFAMRVKSPFSQSALFGFIGWLPLVRSWPTTAPPRQFCRLMGNACIWSKYHTGSNERLTALESASLLQHAMLADVAVGSFLSILACPQHVRSEVILEMPGQRPNSCSKAENRRQQAFLRHKTAARFSNFRSALPRCFHPMDPDEGASEWQRTRNGRGFVRPTMMDRASASRSTRAFCGLQKLSADSLLARRPSLRPPPMTTNHSHGRYVGDRFPKTVFDFSLSATVSSCLAYSHR